MASMRVVVVEDRDLARHGLQAVINKLENCQLVAGCADIAELNRQLQHDCPHVLILDDTLPGIDTVRFVRRLKNEYPGLKIIVFGSHLDANCISGLIDANVDGVIAKTEELLSVLSLAFSFVKRGELFISPQLSRAAFTYTKSNKPIELSERLKDVLSLMALGLEVKQIAKTLSISKKAVYSARERLKELLNATSTADILLRAIELRLIEPKKTDER